MAKCGIEKYDELPSRVGWKDVDAMRAALNSLNRGQIMSRVASFFLGSIFSGWPLITVEEHRQYIQDELDEAVKKYDEEAEDDISTCDRCGKDFGPVGSWKIFQRRVIATYLTKDLEVFDWRLCDICIEQLRKFIEGQPPQEMMAYYRLGRKHERENTDLEALQDQVIVYCPECGSDDVSPTENLFSAVCAQCGFEAKFRVFDREEA